MDKDYTKLTPLEQHKLLRVYKKDLVKITKDIDYFLIFVKKEEILEYFELKATIEEEIKRLTQAIKSNESEKH